MEYYILTGFLTLLLGPFVGFIPPVLFLLYYPITKLVFKALKKDTKKLDDFYLAVPRFFNFPAITNFIKEWFIMPPINFFSWIPRAILSLLKFQFTAIEFFFVTVPNFIFKVLNFLVDTLLIAPIRFFTDYFIKITDWIASGDAADYYIQYIIFYYELYFFQIQQLFNTFIKSSFVHIFGKDPVIDVIRLPDNMFFLGNIF